MVVFIGLWLMRLHAISRIPLYVLIISFVRGWLLLLRFPGLSRPIRRRVDVA
jgi:hypothetical protein